MIVCENFGIAWDGIVIPNPSIGESVRLCAIFGANVVVDLIVVTL